MILSLQSQTDFQIVRAGHALATPTGAELTPGNNRQARIGLTSGCYDLLHYMHLVYLERCARLCDFLVVGLDSDDLIRATKGADRPHIPETHRVAMVAALKCVGAAFVMGEVIDFAVAAERLRPAFIFKNQAFTAESGTGKPRVIGLEWGAELVIVPDVVMPDSTTAIVDSIRRKP